MKQQTLNGSKPEELCVIATGGGAYKFYDRIRDVLGVDVLREDEMECLIIGTETLSRRQRAAQTNRPKQALTSLLQRSPARCSRIVKHT